MNHLEEKYINNRIAPQELSQLRDKLNVTTDEELSLEMEMRWDNDDIDTSLVDHEHLSSIWNNICKKISPKERSLSWNKVWKFVQIAAVIMLPILLVSSVYFYNVIDGYSLQETLISTADNERANVTLPDGSKVALNENSELKYNPKSFNKDSRQIEFEGEAYFDVARDASNPFTILSNSLSVKVLGTKFNLYSRNDDHLAKLELAKGKVLFTAIETNKSVTMKPNQKVVLNKYTNELSLIDLAEGDMSDVTSWQRKELVFRNATLLSVLKSLEKNYNVKIQYTNQGDMDDLFTGTMSSTDLNEDLEILETSYHFRTVMHGNLVVIQWN